MRVGWADAPPPPLPQPAQDPSLAGSMSLLRAATLLALSVLLLAGSALAQENDIDPSIAEAVKSATAQARPAAHPLTNMPPGVATVETAYIFPEYPAPKPQFPAGEANNLCASSHVTASPVIYSRTCGQARPPSPLPFLLWADRDREREGGRPSGNCLEGALDVSMGEMGAGRDCCTVHSPGSRSLYSDGARCGAVHGFVEQDGQGLCREPCRPAL